MGLAAGTNVISADIPIWLADGTATAPSYSFASDQDTGIWRASADYLVVSTGGAGRLSVNNTEFNITVQTRAPNGTFTLPAYSFLSDTNTGIYLNGSDDMVLVAGGQTVGRGYVSGSTTPAWQVPDGSLAIPGLQFNVDPDTGMYRAGPDSLGFSAGGALALLCNSGGNAISPGRFFISDGSPGNPALAFLNNQNTGIYRPGPEQLAIATQGVQRLNVRDTDIVASVGVIAPSFTVSSSRSVKRETGKPTRAADILSRLRPVLYRLLAGDDSEQLGLIAEEVHEICPQLSNGKTVSYDRLALLLLADWHESRAAA
jgi:hypothetical protein